MDNGYLAPGETLDDEYDVLRDLQPEEVIGIMDQLICFEVGSILYLVGPRRTTSDADCRSSRWRGTRVIHSLSHSSRPAISINFCGQSRKSYEKPVSFEMEERLMRTCFYTWSYGLTASVCLRPVTLCLAQ